MYNSQWQQDKILHENIFKGKKDGIFVDVGAHDGKTGSNSYFFENLGWKGICIEPIHECFEKLCKTRNCICVQGCAYNKTGTIKFNRQHGYTEMLSGIIESYPEKHLTRINNEMKQMGDKSETLYVDCYKLSYLLEKYGINHVDYLSIDTEGSELQVLQGIDFDKVNFEVIDFEVNYNEEIAPIQELLEQKGYSFYSKIGGDIIYLNNFRS